MADTATNLPMLLLTHRLVDIMNQIRYKSRHAADLREEIVKSFRDVQATEQTISLIEEELKDEDITDERKVLLEQRKADAELSVQTRRKEWFSMDDDEEKEKRDLKLIREKFLSTIEEALADADILAPIPETVDKPAAEEQQKDDGTKPTEGS